MYKVASYLEKLVIDCSAGGFIINKKEAETRKFLANAFRDGEIKTTGTDIDKLMPPVSRFGGGGARAKKKQGVVDKLKGFFERFFGIGEMSFP